MTTITSGPCTISIVNPPSSLLGEAAALLSSGEWLNMNTGDIYNAAGSVVSNVGTGYKPGNMTIFVGGGGAGVRMGYMSKGDWNDAGGTHGLGAVYIFCGNENEALQHCMMDEYTNSWTDIGVPDHVQANYPGNPDFHSWEHVSFDHTRHQLWHRPYHGNTFWLWSGSGTSWTQYPFNYSSLAGYLPSISSTTYHAGLDALLACQASNDPNGQLMQFPASGSGNGSNLSTTMNGILSSEASCFCQYNRQSSWSFMGMDTTYFLMSPSNVITGPFSLPGGFQGGLGTTNRQGIPITGTDGNFYGICAGSDAWWKLIPSTNTWTQMTSLPPFVTNYYTDGTNGDQWRTFGSCCTPIWTYGVTLLMKGWNATYNSTNNPEAWLYKP